jgi:hypothetical protein
VSDDGTIRLTAYRDGLAVSVVVLDPARAVHLASELIRAALPRLQEGKTC